ncbi:Translation initiation factor IF-3 [Alphaproteobacteria bacterium]
MVGTIAFHQALTMAREKGLDLVEIVPNAIPPVCKIMDYGKYKYEQQKKLHEARKKQKIVEVKEIKVRPTIAIGDYRIKLRNAEKFLKEENKVRISLVFKGREVTHEEVGFAIINRFKRDLETIAKVELEPKMEGKQIFMVLTPR